MKNYHRDDQPPRPGPRMRIERLKANERWTVCLLAPLWGIWTHWHNDARRSQGCEYDDEKKEGDCEGCKRGLPRRWKGYLHVFHYERHAECFLEVPPGATWDILAQIPPGENFRGLRLNIKRSKGDKARLQCTLLASEANLDDLPTPKDPMAILEQLWGEEFRKRKPPGNDILPMGDVG